MSALQNQAFVRTAVVRTPWEAIVADVTMDLLLTPHRLNVSVRTIHDLKYKCTQIIKCNVEIQGQYLATYAHHSSVSNGSVSSILFSLSVISCLTFLYPSWA